VPRSKAHTRGEKQNFLTETVGQMENGLQIGIGRKKKGTETRTLRKKNQNLIKDIETAKIQRAVGILSLRGENVPFHSDTEHRRGDGISGYPRPVKDERPLLCRKIKLNGFRRGVRLKGSGGELGSRLREQVNKDFQES